MMDGLRRAAGRVLDWVSTAPLSRYLEDEAGGGRPEAGGGSVLTHHGVGEGDAMLPQNRPEGAELTRKLRVEVRKAAQREHERREELFYEMLRREIARNGEGLVRYVPDRYELPVPGAMRLLKGGMDLVVKGRRYRALLSGQSGEEELVISIYERRGV
jgi:hypothetical protein